MVALSAGRTWAVARYELTWDLRKKRTYLILGLFLLAVFSFGYALPVVAGQTTAAASYGNFTDNLWWMNVAFLVFNGFISGLFPLLIGGFISTDSLASEFDKNTIVPLLSQPVRRIEVYAGKLLEKFLLMLAVSILLTVLAIVTAESSMGAQVHLDWFPWVVLVALAAFAEYTALAFFFGSFVRSGSMVLGVLIGVFFGMSVAFGILALKFGAQEWMALLPVINADYLVYVTSHYLVSPTGNIVLQAAMVVTQSQPNSVSLVSALQYVVAGLAANLVVPVIAGYALFRRADVSG